MSEELSVLNGGKFESPQTSSVYNKVYDDGKYIVCYRDIDDEISGSFRIRIQGSEDALNEIAPRLTLNWGAIKQHDHLSVVVRRKDVPAAIGDVFRALATMIF